MIRDDWSRPDCPTCHPCAENPACESMYVKPTTLGCPGNSKRIQVPAGISEAEADGACRSIPVGSSLAMNLSPSDEPNDPAHLPGGRGSDELQKAYVPAGSGAASNGTS